MDHRMFKAACNGDIEELHVLLQENPFLLTDDSLINLHENPITIAIKARQLLFVREIKKLRPELVAQPNQDGLLPLHIACSYGYVEIVKELLSTPSCDITCRVRSGTDGKVALHYAAINGSVDIIDELVTASSDSLKEVTYFGETALHLAVKYFKFEALKRLLIWLEHVGMIEMVNKGDKEGNTLLHYAVSRKQLEAIEYLLEWNNSTGNNESLVNAVNKKGFTAMDLLDILTEFSSDLELRKVLLIAGGVSSEIHCVATNSSSHKIEVPNSSDDITGGACKCNTRPDKKPDNWIEYFRFQYKRDSPGEARDALLVVAALFATVTFQAGINPPEYIFKNYQHDENRLFILLTVFVCANTLALSAAMMIIEGLTSNMPFQRELKTAGFCMMFGYGWSIGCTQPTGVTKDIMIFVSTIFPWLIRITPLMVKEYKSEAPAGDTT
ncbi:hypothetical protein K7X08_023120 [Anisodus acutangulus]|uniref:PGG domain-containing protein n=1 Tax=Anisodus acutangulus TaxID=402998 RepID=A0A9Q1MEZ6_9SOLA|nr:hypothetical protein K7X08_023120 [Anisodus acutangulus]